MPGSAASSIRSIFRSVRFPLAVMLTICRRRSRHRVPAGQPLRLEAVDEGHDVAAVDAEAEHDVLLAGRPYSSRQHKIVLVLTSPAAAS